MPVQQWPSLGLEHGAHHGSSRHERPGRYSYSDMLHRHRGGLQSEWLLGLNRVERVNEGTAAGESLSFSA